MPTKTGLKWSGSTFLHNRSYFAVQNMFIKPRLGCFDEQASWKSRKVVATIPTWWRAGLWTGLLCSQLFHLPLTLDMDGCGWSGSHLSLALSHTHCFLFHTHHLSHTFGLSLKCAVAQVRPGNTFLMLFFMLPHELNRVPVQSNTSCFRWLDTLPQLLADCKVKSAVIVFIWGVGGWGVWGIPGTGTQECGKTQLSVSGLG